MIAIRTPTSTMRVKQFSTTVTTTASTSNTKKGNTTSITT